jgi:hypothetical protein
MRTMELAEIAENRDKVELLAKTLLERETMDGRDVARLVGIEMKEPEREEAKPADETKPGEAQPDEPRTEVQ